MKETEITVQVFNKFDEIDDILKNQGFEMIRNFQLNDWYFSQITNVNNVLYGDLLNSSFLVRQVLTDKEIIQLCYKQKEIDELGNVIAEEKISTDLSSLSNANCKSKSIVNVKFIPLVGSS